jgi:carbohydrate-selective porin OprB
MKPIPLLLALGTTLPVVAAPDAFAADAHASADTTLWTRKHLTGEWGGQRASLANRGVVLDLSTTGYYALLHLNTGKPGLREVGGFSPNQCQ